jgi:aminoglycoside 2''-phosphotransferase
MTEAETSFILAVQDACPTLHISSCELNGSGYTNDVLVVNNDLIFRFPRSIDAIESLERENRVLARLQDQLSLQVPRPEFFSHGVHEPGKVFTGYRRIDGDPLSKHLREIDERTACMRIAPALARFLHGLHNAESLVRDLELPLHGAHRRKGIPELHKQIRASLYPMMAVESGERLTALFERFLANDDNFSAEIALRHGDLNPGNILVEKDSWALTGVIDFGSTGLDDPCVDLGLVLLWGQLTWGDQFTRCLLDHYGVSGQMGERAAFYKIFIAMMLALQGLETGDDEAVTNAIALV